MGGTPSVGLVLGSGAGGTSEARALAEMRSCDTQLNSEVGIAAQLQAQRSGKVDEPSPSSSFFCTGCSPRPEGEHRPSRQHDLPWGTCGAACLKQSVWRWSNLRGLVMSLRSSPLAGPRVFRKHLDIPCYVPTPRCPNQGRQLPLAWRAPFTTPSLPSIFSRRFLQQCCAERHLCIKHGKLQLRGFKNTENKKHIYLENTQIKHRHL